MRKPSLTVKISVATIELVAKILKNQRLAACCEAAKRNKQNTFEIMHLGPRY